MPKTRILVVDDAVVVRKILTDVIQSEPDLQVAATAPNGRIALAKIPQVNPDLVTLDVEMPDMNGVETLKAIRATHPDLPVIMFSTLTERGSRVTLDALLAGANDYVTKPANVGSVSEGFAAVRSQLVPKIRVLCGLPDPDAPPPRRVVAAPARPRLAPAALRSARTDVVAIGVSTGGPNALAQVFSALPAGLPVPIVIVQHMPPNFTRMLAERLDQISPLRVAEAVDGAVLQPGTVWIAPGDRHMAVRRTGVDVRLALNQGPPENSCRPSVDVLFRSVAAVYGAAALGVVLTGMGQDGLRGVEHLKEVGSNVVIQDEASSVVWGMPGAVAAAGLADRIVPLAEVAQTIGARLRFGREQAAPVQARTAVR